MNPEYLSDGQLFEGKEEWEKAFEADLNGTAERLAEMQKSLEKEFYKQSTESFDPESFRHLLDSCRNALKELLASLPPHLNIFPTENEKQAVLSPVLSFSTRLNELLTLFWELYHTLGREHASLNALFAKAQTFQSALFVAVSASTKFDLSPNPAETLGACICTMEEISGNLRDLYKQNEALNRLYHSFFCEFAEKVVQAADIEHKGTSASPETLYRLCGEMTATLRLIEDQTFPASLPEFPLA